MDGAESRPTADPCFFVSYTRSDRRYIRRLAVHLRLAGVRIWYDNDLAWGDQFTQAIPDRIRYSLGVIVIMSPAAEQSPWVEREILEGQRYDRQFLPILLRGERHFLLASSHYFDARTGALPGDREIRQLKALQVRATAGRPAPPDAPVVTLAPPTPPTSAVTWPDVDSSAAKLRSFLADGLLQNADILTTALILQSVGRLRDGWLRLSDGAGLPWDVLSRIDAIWSSLTGGTHGFRTQLSLSVAATGRDGSWADFARLASVLDWKPTGATKTPLYGEFIDRPEYPVGFFPTLRNPQLEKRSGWHDRWMNTAVAVHRRLREWRWNST